jgi:hypothetical protein
VDPLAGDGFQAFPWEEVYRALDGPAENVNPDMERFAKALKTLITWICGTQLNRNADRVIGRRALALGWLLGCEGLEKKSLTSIAKTLGASKMTLSVRVCEATTAFGLTNRRQAYAHWRRKKWKTR